MKAPRLISITVNYCCAEAILAGLDTTCQQLGELGGATLWIVDNNSPDGSAGTLREAIAERGYSDLVEVIDAGANGGFGAGNNVGIQAALDLPHPPEYLYFLNPDAMPAPGAIRTLLDFMDAHPRAGIGGSCLTDEAGQPQTSFFRFPSFVSEIEGALRLGFLQRLLQDRRVSQPAPDSPQQVDWVSGASFIARTSALRQTGGFDETFFLYWEEIELCHRIRAAGYDIHAIPEAVVIHTEGVSTGVDVKHARVPAYWFASRNYFFRSTGRGGPLVLLNSAVALGLVLQRIHRGLRGKPLTPPHYLRDFLTYWLRPAKDPRT